MVSVTFVWDGGDGLGIPTAKAQEIVGNAALYDWRRGLGPTVEVDGETVQKPWEDLSNQEKLDMVYEAAQRLIQAQSKSALYTTNLDTARDETDDYIETEYGDLG